MKNRIAFSFLSVLLLNMAAMAQSKKDPVLLTVGGDRIVRSEFEKIYRKNNSKENLAEKKSVNDYLDLYINYKLKVKEAEELKLDTSKAFRDELEGYRKQLAQPYLTDKSVSDALVHEAYDRLKKDVRASHILIKVLPDALPKDTLEAYQRALKIRESIVKGADFGSVALESSDDPSVKENKGDLGYFTALQMVYPFENAVYNGKVGEVSQPVRTKYGYHIIKVTGSRPAQGEIHTAHIMVKAGKGISPDDSAKAYAKIKEIYEKLKKGEKFEDLARQFSDDVNSGKNGGTLPWFGTGRMLPEFENAAFALKNNGDFSEPIRTAYGWHIIKRLEKKELSGFEAMQNELKTKISKDSRSEKGKFSLIQKVKKEYNFKEFPKAKQEFFALLDTSLNEGKWSAEKVKNLNNPMFKLQDKSYTQQDFAKYLADHQVKRKGAPKDIASSIYNQFVNESCIAYEESHLDQKYGDFHSLMQEYRDGILLFELTDRKVWSKAVKDTAGLKAFYEKNKGKFMWGERLDAVIYSCASPEIANKVKEMVKAGIKNDSILASINKNSQLNLSVREGKFGLGDNDVIDSIKWVPGFTENMKKKNQTVFVQIKAKLAPEPKSLEEAKGLVTADYQAYLEKEWIAELKKKYAVTVDSSVLASISK